jgi:cell division septation protein DedD
MLKKRLPFSFKNTKLQIKQIFGGFMTKYQKILLITLTLFMLIGCSMNNTVSVGSTVDIDNFKHPSNVIKYQWSFDTKPPTSRLDPRDFIPSNYHPNVTFIPDQAGKYTIRLSMITSDGNVINKSFSYSAQSQGNYLSGVESNRNENTKTTENNTRPIVKKEPVKKLAPKIIEVPVIREKVIHKKTTVTKIPNQWKTAPLPGQNPEEIKEEPKYTTQTKTEVINEQGKVIDRKDDGTKTPNIYAKYTLQVSSSVKQVNANELKNRLRKEGYDAFIQTAMVNGKTQYRIRIGHFETYNQAKSYKQHLINTTDFEPWIDKIQ